MDLQWRPGEGLSQGRQLVQWTSFVFSHRQGSALVQTLVMDLPAEYHGVFKW